MAIAGKGVKGREEFRMMPGLEDWWDGENYGDRALRAGMTGGKLWFVESIGNNPKHT